MVVSLKIEFIIYVCSCHITLSFFGSSFSSTTFHLLSIIFNIGLTSTFSHKLANTE
ncbi:MAG: hypothetical protein LBC61_01615 [Candidatus Peribacteria bacterium]|nr:hypothetical protein [Candidatus Peribacteria bacterium]